MRNRLGLFGLVLVLALSMGVPAGAQTVAPDCERVTLERSPDDPLPVGVLVPCPGIRPGAEVWTANTVCTMNFVFRGTSYDEEGNPVDEGLFIGTAGHCIVGEGLEETFPPGQGPQAMDSSQQGFGEFAYAVNRDNHDFALIRVDDDREHEVRAGLCHFGGPTGTTPGAAVGERVHHFGQGLAYGMTVPGRSGHVVSSPYAYVEDGTMFAGAALFGDSGSPVITADGRALGVLVAILAVAPTVVLVTNLAPQLPMAEAALGIDFELVTAAFGA